MSKLSSARRDCYPQVVPMQKVHKGFALRSHLMSIMPHQTRISHIAAMGLKSKHGNDRFSWSCHWKELDTSHWFWLHWRLCIVELYINEHQLKRRTFSDIPWFLRNEGLYPGSQEVQRYRLYCMYDSDVMDTHVKLIRNVFVELLIGVPARPAMHRIHVHGVDNGRSSGLLTIRVTRRRGFFRSVVVLWLLHVNVILVSSMLMVENRCCFTIRLWRMLQVICKQTCRHPWDLVILHRVSTMVLFEMCIAFWLTAVRDLMPHIDLSFVFKSHPFHKSPASLRSQRHRGKGWRRCHQQSAHLPCQVQTSNGCLPKWGVVGVIGETVAPVHENCLRAFHKP